MGIDYPWPCDGSRDCDRHSATLPRGSRVANSCILECPKRADSAPTGTASGTTGVRAIAALPLRARNSLHRPKLALVDAPANIVGPQFAACVGRAHRFSWRSFRSTDAMTDNSRKLARRRARVSVVSSTFSIRRDRCSASDLSIARRSRSSISSFKCSGPLARAWPTGKSGKRYRALRPVRACRSSDFSGQVRGRPRGSDPRSGLMLVRRAVSPCAPQTASVRTSV